MPHRNDPVFCLAQQFFLFKLSNSHPSAYQTISPLSIFFRSPSLILHIHSKCVKSDHLSPLLTICMLSSSSYIQTDLIPLIWQHLSLSCCRLLSLWEMRFYLFISFSFFCADFLWYLYVVLALFPFFSSFILRIGGNIKDNEQGYALSRIMLRIIHAEM